jgi:hypothetical protein
MCQATRPQIEGRTNSRVRPPQVRTSEFELTPYERAAATASAVRNGDGAQARLVPPAYGAYPAGTSEGRVVGTTTCMPAARSSRAPRPFTVSVQPSEHFGHWNLTTFPDSGVTPPSSSTNSASPIGVSTVPQRSHVLRRRVLTNPMMPRQADSAPPSTEISGKRKANSGCQHAAVSRCAGPRHCRPSAGISAEGMSLFGGTYLASVLDQPLASGIGGPKCDNPPRPTNPPGDHSRCATRR